MTHRRLKEIRRLPTDRGERVTFFPETGIMRDRAVTQPGQQGQTNRRKSPVLMRFSRGCDFFHEKITFGYQLGRACCIHPSIVGNGTGMDAVFRDKRRQRLSAYQG